MVLRTIFFIARCYSTIQLVYVFIFQCDCHNYIIIIYNRKAKSRKIHFTQCSCYLRLFISTKSWINISFCDSRFGDLLKQEIKNKKTKIQKLRKIINEFQAIIHLNAINSYFPKKNRYFFITLIIFDFCFRKTIDRNERISNIEYKNRPPKMFRNVKTMFFLVSWVNENPYLKHCSKLSILRITFSILMN